MLSSETLIILLGTLLFFGFAIWMAFYSRGNNAEETDEEAAKGEGKKTSAVASNKT